MAPATAEPLMDEQEFLEALERFDREDYLPATNHLPVPVWAFDTANDEPDYAPARGEGVWLVSGFLVGAAAAVLLFRDRVANILTLLR